MSFAGFLGYLIGTMIDPLTWVVAGIFAFGFKTSSWPTRLIFAIAANLVLDILIYLIFRTAQYGASPYALPFALLATGVWFLVLEGLRRLLGRRTRVTNAKDDLVGPENLPRGYDLIVARADNGPKPNASVAPGPAVSSMPSLDGVEVGGKPVPTAHEPGTPPEDFSSASVSKNDLTGEEHGHLLLRAQTGDPEAQFQLGRSYFIGENTLQDYVLAHMWLNLAASGGVAGAASMRQSVSQHMSVDQIAEAQALARNWSPSTPSE